MSYLDNIPSALRMHPKWMVCSADGSKWEKTPIDPIEGYAVEGRGKNNPEVWLTYDDARQHTRVGTRMMGFICTADDEYTIIDLDDINNLKGKHTEESIERQQAILTWAYENGCYGEWSKSGNGCHIIVKGKLNGNIVKQSQLGFEAYGHNCEYVIITGRKIEGFGSEPIDLPEEWSAYFNEFVSNTNSEWNQYGDGIDSDFLAKMDAEYTYDEQKLYTEKWAKVESWKNGERYKYFRLGLDIGETGEDASANDFDCLQACYSVLKGHPERELAACRMFMALERADRIKRGEKNKAYLIRFSLPNIIARVRASEEREAMERSGWEVAVGRMAVNGTERLNDDSSITETSPSNMKLAPQPKPKAPWSISQGPEAPIFKFLTPDEMKALPPLEWVVQGMFHKKSVNAIYGWSAVGKSFIALDLVAAIAEGREWFGKYTRQLPVDYLALEGSQGIQQRLKAYEKGNKRDYPKNVEFYPGRFNLLEMSHILGLIEQRQKTKGGVIVIDTFSKGTAGINENDAGEMAKAVEHLELIKDKLDACVIVVHHSTKIDGKTGIAGNMRGSGVLQAGLDAVLRVEIDEHKNHQWVADKVKEGKVESPVLFDLPAIEVGIEIDPITGEELKIESCYIHNPNIAEGVNSHVPPGVVRDQTPTHDYSEKQNKPRSAKAANEDSVKRNGSNINSLKNAIVVSAQEARGMHKGTPGAPEVERAAPRDRVIDMATDDRFDAGGNSTRAKMKGNIETCLQGMIEKEIARQKTDANGQKWVWLV